MDINKKLQFELLSSNADYFHEIKAFIFPDDELDHKNDYNDFKNLTFSYDLSLKSIINDFEIYYDVFTYLLSVFKTDKNTFVKNKNNIYRYFILYYFSELSLIDKFEIKFENNVLAITKNKILKKIRNMVDENAQSESFLKFSRDNKFFYENSDEEIIQIFNTHFSYNEYINVFSSNIFSVIECFIIIDNQLFKSKYSSFAEDALSTIRTELGKLDDILIIDDYKIFQAECVNKHNQRSFNF